MRMISIINIVRGRGNNGRLDRDFRNIIKSLPPDKKRDLILQYGDEGSKRRAASKTDGQGGPKARSPQELAEDVACWADDLPSASTVAPLLEALEGADSRWIDAFRNANGVTGLCGAMEELADSRDLHLEDGDSINPKQVPKDEREGEEEVVHCLMVLLNKEMGLKALEGSANLWPVIARSALDSTTEYVRLSLLKVLTVMVEMGKDGLKVVLNALDVVKAQKNNDLRFAVLVDALANAEEDSALPIAIGVTVFLNTVLSSAFEFEERVPLRGEMIEAGMLQAVENARSRFGITVDELFADSDSSDEDEPVGRRPRGGSGGGGGGPRAAARTFNSAAASGNSKRLAEAMFLSNGSDGSTNSLGGSSSTGTARSTFSPASLSPSLTNVKDIAASARVTQLKSDLAAQLDLFDRVTDEDALDAMANGGVAGEGGLDDLAEGDEEGNGDSEGSEVDRSGKEPQAVRAMRALAAAVEGDEAVSVELELIADKLGLMGGTAGCGPDLWRTVRDAVSSAAEQGRRASASGAADGQPSSSPPPAPPLPARLPGTATDAAVPPAPSMLPAAIPRPPGLAASGAIPAAPPLPMPVQGGIPPPPPLPGLPPPKGIPLPPAMLPGLPPPPPPQGMLPPPLALGGKKLMLPPGPKRRGVYWQAIKAGIAGTVFEDIKGEKVDVPKDLLLEGFAEKPKEPKKVGVNAGCGGDGDSGAAAVQVGEEKKKPKQEPLLGAKALQYGIVFSTVSVSPETVRDAVMSMNLSFLNLDTLEKLQKLQAPPAELAILKAFKGEESELVEVERFMVLASRIPSYEARLRCAQIMQSFGPDVEFTSGRLSIVGDAISEVSESKKLKRLLAVVLAVGNFLNEGTPRAATGITLESLLKLVTVRRTSKRASAGGGEDNLVHALVEWASSAEPSLLLLGEDLPGAAGASRLSLEDLKKEVLACSKDFRVLEAKLEEAKKGQVLEEDKFVEAIEPFLAQSKGSLDKLKSELAKVEEAYTAVATKFGENPRTTPNEAFFDMIKRVVLMIEGAARENQERAEAEAARVRRENRANKRKKERMMAKKAKEKSAVDLQSLLRAGVHGMRGVVTGTVNDEFDRIKEDRAKESEAFREMNETDDAGERDNIRGKLNYQRSVNTFGAQPSSSGGWTSTPRRGPSSVALAGRFDREASALRQASLIRQSTARNQASFARMGSRATKERPTASVSGGGGSRGVGAARTGSKISGDSGGSSGGRSGRGLTSGGSVKPDSFGGGGGGRGGSGVAKERSRRTDSSGGGVGGGRGVAGGSRRAVGGGGSVPAPPLGGATKSGLGRRGVLHVPIDNGEDLGDGSDDSLSPKVSRGDMSKRLVETRGRTLNSRRGPVG